MYTSIILHQINKNRWSRDCAACESHPETVQHIFLECPSSKAFRDQLWQLITNKCNLQVVGTLKDQIQLFGLFIPAPKNVNSVLINFLFSVAKHALYICRCDLLFENKKSNSWFLYVGLVRWYLKSLFLVKREVFMESFLPNNCFVVVENDHLSLKF